jgi:phenylacetate-CoA ligase
MSTKLPNYFLTTDFEALFRRHPLPDDFATGMYLWSADRLRAYQEELFKDVLQYAWNNAFYRDVWGSHGIEPGDIRGLDDLPTLPIVSVHDFKDAIEMDPPFGRHQGITPAGAVDKPLKIQSSGGTTGRPRPTFFGPVEWEVQAIQMARSLYLQGARPGDVMLIPATLSLANMGWCYFQAAFYYLGVVPLTTGSGVVTASRRQVEYMRDWGVNILVGFPEYLLHLAKVAREETDFDVRELGIKLISTYLGPDTDGQLRAQVEEAYAAKAYDNYGTHEIGLVSFESVERDGMLFHDDTIFVEVADVDTGEVLPDGSVGNLVATSLHRQHPPLIRYNLMDLIELKKPAVTNGGSSLRRMGQFLGRSDDMVKLRGTNLYPMACVNAVVSDSRTTGQWLCVVDRVDEAGDQRDEMTVLVERAGDHVDDAAAARDLAVALKADLGARVSVEMVAPGSLAEATNFGREGKVRRLLDRRPGYERKY